MQFSRWKTLWKVWKSRSAGLFFQFVTSEYSGERPQIIHNCVNRYHFAAVGIDMGQNLIRRLS